MAIVQTINTVYQFEAAFKKAGRGDQFSWEGLKALFTWLEEYSEDIGENVDLDVVALCCDYNECESIEDFMQQYGKYSNIDMQEFSEADESEQLNMIRDYLNDRTIVISCTDNCILFGSF